MVRPTIKGTVPTKHKAIGTTDNINKFKVDKQFREKVLLNTANKWAERNGFKGDITFKRVSETGKSFKIAVDGKELKRSYCITAGTNPRLISPMAFH